MEAVGDELFIGGLSASFLVDKYAEPLYVYDAELFERQVIRLRSLLPTDVRLLYSVKANPNVSVVGFFHELVDGADISSLGELLTAEKAGFKSDQLFFVGPSKSSEELSESVRRGLGAIVVESEEELFLVNTLASKVGNRPNVLIRVNPECTSASGSKLIMSGTARQFGIDESLVCDLLRRSRSLPHLSIKGIHVYLGTRILGWRTAINHAATVLATAARLQLKGFTCEIIDIGGGLGIPYFWGEHEFDLKEFCMNLGNLLDEKRNKLGHPTFVMELGRYLTAEAGVFISRVRFVKKSRGQKFVLTGGGIHHHHASMSTSGMMRGNFPIEVLNKMGYAKSMSATICGPLCTPADVLATNVELPDVRRGDLIGVLKAGAYGLTASPTGFLSHNTPREVLVYGGKDYLVRRNKTAHDVLEDQTFHRLTPQGIWDRGESLTVSKGSDKWQTR